MLIGIDPLLSPPLLCALAEMGHGDEIAIVDANFPAASVARRLIRVDGADAPRVLRAILTLMPLDTFVPDPVAVMQRVVLADDPHDGTDGGVPEVVREFERCVARANPGKNVPPVPFTALSRDVFYERARNAYAVVATQERRLYGNILLKKGVIGPDA